MLDNWSQYAGFAMSFVFIGSLWLNHHAVFARVRRADSTLNWINLAILGAVRPVIGALGYVTAGLLGWFVTP